MTLPMQEGYYVQLGYNRPVYCAFYDTAYQLARANLDVYVDVAVYRLARGGVWTQKRWKRGEYINAPSGDGPDARKEC